MFRKTDLHPYQQDLVTALYEHDELLAIVPMGGGKTVSALTAAQELHDCGAIRGGIILAPKRVAREVWPREIEEWEHLGLNLVLVTGSREQRKKKLAREADLWIVGIDSTDWLVRELKNYPADDPRYDIVIIDEMSRYKTMDGKWGTPGKRSRQLAIAADDFKIRWGLTGTPMPGSEADMFQPARILTRRRIWDEDFLSWRMEHFKPDNPVTQFRWELREDHKEQVWGDIARFCYVVDANQLPPQPELVPVHHWVDLPKRAREAYDEMVKDLVVECDGDFVMAENQAVAAGKLDQIAQGFVYRDGEVFEHLHTAKIEALRDLVAGLGGQQAMITYWYREDLDVLTDAFPHMRVLTGDKGGKWNETSATDEWNKGNAQLLAVHPASAGHGLNLQKSSAGQIIHYCLSWSSELLEQVRARIARQGNKNERVIEHMILVRDTLDDLKLSRHGENIEAQNLFMQYAKKHQLS